MLKCPVNNLLVTVDKKYNDNIGGLLLDTSFEPEQYATLNGVVISAPDKVEQDYWRTKIQMNIKPGDEVWFRYGVIFDYKSRREGETPEYKNLIVYEGKEYWKVDYSEVICIVRDGQISVPTAHIIAEPVQERQSSTLLSVTHKNTAEDKGRVVASPDWINCSKGDLIPLEKEYVQKYQMFGKLHYVIPARRLIAKF